MHKRTRLSRRRGFTLVELLVVVAIIALLVSILLPSLGRAKAAARLVVCQTNMHGMGRGAFMYASENNRCVPRDGNWSDPTDETIYPDDGTYNCFSRISPYVGGPKIPLNKDVYDFYLYPIYKEISMYMCPSVPALFPDHVLAYISNGYNFQDPTNWGSAAVPIDSMPFAPADIGYIAEANVDEMSSGKERTATDMTDSVFGAYDFPCRYYPVGDANVGKVRTWCTTYDSYGDPSLINRRMILDGDDRHNGKTPVAFFDGHAEARGLNPESLPLDLFHPKIDAFFD